jgi:thiamine biosynthesis lipoprotein
VQLEDPDAWIDLGAIAKGYIADKIAEYLIARGVTSAVIDLGGDVVAVGSKQDGSLWRIGVRKPGGNANELLGVVETGEASIVSSGIYERKFEKDGVIYHHILDPNTGMPARGDVISATVVAENAVIGEGLSTIIILAGSESVKALIDLVPGLIGVVLVLENGELLKYGDMRWSD